MDKTRKVETPKICPFCQDKPCLREHCPYTEEYLRLWRGEYVETCGALTDEHLNGLLELCEKK